MTKKVYMVVALKVDDDVADDIDFLGEVVKDALTDVGPIRSGSAAANMTATSGWLRDEIVNAIEETVDSGMDIGGGAQSLFDLAASVAVDNVVFYVRGVIEQDFQASDFSEELSSALEEEEEEEETPRMEFTRCQGYGEGCVRGGELRREIDDHGVSQAHVYDGDPDVEGTVRFNVHPRVPQAAAAGLPGGHGIRWMNIRTDAADDEPEWRRWRILDPRRLHEIYPNYPYPL